MVRAPTRATSSLLDHIVVLLWQSPSTPAPWLPLPRNRSWQVANNLLNGCRDKHVTIHCHLEHTCFSTCCRPSQRRQLTGQKHACANGQGDKHIRIDKETVRQARGKLRYRGTKENARMFHIFSNTASNTIETPSQQPKTGSEFCGYFEHTTSRFYSAEN